MYAITERGGDASPPHRIPPLRLHCGLAAIGRQIPPALVLTTLLAACWGDSQGTSQPPTQQRPLGLMSGAMSTTTRPVVTLPAAAAGARSSASQAGSAAEPAGSRASGPWPFRDPPPDDPYAAKKRPMSIRDLYRIKSLRDPRISPDGRRVVFVQTSYHLEQGTSETHLWVVGVDGKGLRRLTRSGVSNHSPRWSPDGREIIFVSTRAGSPQLFRLSLAGGDPEQLTHLPTGAQGPLWSPDGKRVVFRSRVFPDIGADAAASRARLKRLRGGPTQAVMADNLFFRHWTSYDDGRRSHLLSLELEGGRVTDLTPGPHNAPPISLHGNRDYAISPDGKELCFQSNHDPPSRRASSTNNDLFVVPMAMPPLRPLTGAGAALPRVPGLAPAARRGPKPRREAVNITAKNRAWDGACAYSPNGLFIAYLMHRRPGYESDRPRLVLLERRTGKLRELTPQLDNWISAFHWLPDSKRILFSAPTRGRWPLFLLNTGTGEIRKLPAPPSVRGFDLSRDGRLIAFVHSTVARPPELFVVSIDGTTPRQLTQVNAPLAAEVDLRPAEELWLPGDGGKKIHTFVVKPHGFVPGKRYPLILNVHGGPQYQWSDSFRGDWQVYPAAGYVVAFPNTTGSIGYGQRFTEAISRDWGGRVYRDTMAVADALSRLDYVDPRRMGVMGWSYGGSLVNWIGSQTSRFAALASMMGVYDLSSFFATTEEQWFPEWDLGGQPWAPRSYERFSPSRFVASYKTPTLILSGQLDYRIPYTQSIALFTALRKRGVDARLILFKNDGHWPSYVRSMPLYYNAHLEWFHRYLKGGPAPWKTADMVKNRAFK